MKRRTNLTLIVASCIGLTLAARSAADDSSESITPGMAVVYAEHRLGYPN